MDHQDEEREDQPNGTRGFNPITRHSQDLVLGSSGPIKLLIYVISIVVVAVAVAAVIVVVVIAGFVGVVGVVVKSDDLSARSEKLTSFGGRLTDLETILSQSRCQRRWRRQ